MWNVWQFYTAFEKLLDITLKLIVYCHLLCCKNIIHSFIKSIYGHLLACPSPVCPLTLHYHFIARWQLLIWRRQQEQCWVMLLRVALLVLCVLLLVVCIRFCEWLSWLEAERLPLQLVDPLALRCVDSVYNWY